MNVLSSWQTKTKRLPHLLLKAFEAGGAGAFACQSYNPGVVIAPSAADPTRATYLAKTPDR
jgi:hypothetical protein